MNLTKVIGIGELDRQVTIRTKTETIETNGERDWTYSDLATVWAKIEFDIPREKGEDATEKGISDFDDILLTIRYRNDFDTTAIISYDTTEYDISKISEVSRKRFLKIKATERK